MNPLHWMEEVMAVIAFAALLAACALLQDPSILQVMDAEQMERMLDEESAQCGTDMECMEFCPPPADDPDCDGGPQESSSTMRS